MVNSTRKKLRYAAPIVSEPNKTIAAVWRDIIAGWLRQPRTQPDFVLEYLENRFQQQHPREYEKYCKDREQSQHT